MRDVATAVSTWVNMGELPDGPQPLEAMSTTPPSFAPWLEWPDGSTRAHCQRVARHASAIALNLGLEQAEVSSLRLGAHLHDIGKVRVPAGILNKPGRLTAAEFDVMKMHPLWGLEMLDGVELPRQVRASIRSHHEKDDGSGYPDGLRGDEIPLHATIICIADVYDALTSARSYRPAMPIPAAMAEMHARSGWWRPDVYAAFRQAAPASPTARS
jgi:putative nucleotidyltransferase with HDIG domain